jgi:hypothetical protein
MQEGVTEPNENSHWAKMHDAAQKLSLLVLGYPLIHSFHNSWSFLKSCPEIKK